MSSLQQVGNIDQKGHNSLWGRVYSTEGISATLNANGGGAGAKTGLYFISPKIGAFRGRNPNNPNSRKSGLPTQQMLEINHNGTSNCLTSVQKDNVVVDDFYIRRLIPFETFLLQGVKAEDIKIIVSDTQAYKISGNAQSVNVLQELLKAIYKKQELPKNSLFDF